MVPIRLSTDGRVMGGGTSRDGERSRASMMKSHQQAVVVAHVILPICPSTALICFRVHRAISGWRAPIASWSH